MDFRDNSSPNPPLNPHGGERAESALRDTPPAIAPSEEANGGPAGGVLAPYEIPADDKHLLALLCKAPAYLIELKRDGNLVRQWRHRLAPNRFHRINKNSVARLKRLGLATERDETCGGYVRRRIEPTPRGRDFRRLITV